MFDLGKLAFDLVSQLILGIIQDGLKSSTLPFFERRRIERRVEDTTAEVVQGLIPFLEQEKISSDKQQRLVETCVNELKPFAESPAELFKGSLDGQKIFDTLYHDKDLPQEITEDGLKDIYSLLFPRIATLLCKIPAAVKDWENEAWSENYKRFDEVVAQLKALFAQVDELASASQIGADKTLTLLKRTFVQKIGLQLDITGLRADQPLSGKFDDYFVLPVITQRLIEKDKEPVSVVEPNDCFCTFTNSGYLAIVIGTPGAGKSTWSKWLQRETLKTDWSGVGIRIEFRDLKSDELPSIYDLIRKSAGKQLAEDLTLEKIRKWLDNYQIAFILDGFDEVKPTDRNKFVEWIKEIIEVAKGNPFVITSRPLTTDHLEKMGEDWHSWNIEPFDEQRIITYISKWYANTPLLADSNKEIDAEGLAASWLNDSTLGPLTGNPLLLSTLLMVHHLDGKLPNGRANLYKRYVDGMLGIWDDRHKLAATDIQINPDEKRKIIRGMALNLFLTEQETIDENLLLEWLNGFLPKISNTASAADVLTVLRERSGLIIGPGIYSFAHKTIAEFLVAEAVLQGDQHDQLGNRIDRFHLFEHRNDDRWNTVLFLWAGMAAFIDVKSFIDECVREQNWALVFGLFYDQYDKFSLEARKEIFENVKIIGDGFSWSTSRYGIPLASGNVVLVEFPDINLRGLSDYLSMIALLFRAVKNKEILWTNFLAVQGKAYGLIWFTFAHETADSNEWLGIVTSKPDTIDLISWKKYSAHFIYLQYLVSDVIADTARSLRDAYLQIYPDFEGYLSMALLESMIRLLNPSEENEYNSIDKEQLSEKLNLAIDILLEENISKIVQFVSQHINDKEFRGRNDLIRDSLKSTGMLIHRIAKSNYFDINKKEASTHFLKEIRREIRNISN
jgi:hypothetical protein